MSPKTLLLAGGDYDWTDEIAVQASKATSIY